MGKYHSQNLWVLPLHGRTPQHSQPLPPASHRPPPPAPTCCHRVSTFGIKWKSETNEWWVKAWSATQYVGERWRAQQIISSTHCHTLLCEHHYSSATHAMHPLLHPLVRMHQGKLLLIVGGEGGSRGGGMNEELLDVVRDDPRWKHNSNFWL